MIVFCPPVFLIRSDAYVHRDSEDIFALAQGELNSKQFTYFFILTGTKYVETWKILWNTHTKQLNANREW